MLPARPPAHQPGLLMVDSPTPTPYPMPMAPGALSASRSLACHIHTLALSHTGRAVKVGACISRAAGAEVLTEVWLVGAHGTADAAMGAGVVVVAWGTLDCRQEGGRRELRPGKRACGLCGWAGHILMANQETKDSMFLPGSPHFPVRASFQVRERRLSRVAGSSSSSPPQAPSSVYLIDSGAHFWGERGVATHSQSKVGLLVTLYPQVWLGSWGFALGEYGGITHLGLHRALGKFSEGSCSQGGPWWRQEPAHLWCHSPGRRLPPHAWW